MEEELNALDRAALEKQYVESYHYTKYQKLVGGMAVILFILTLVGLGTILFVNVIKLFIK